MSELHNQTSINMEEDKPKNQKEFGWKKFILFILTYLGSMIIFIAFPVVGISVYEVMNEVEGIAESFATGPWMFYLEALAFITTILIFKSSRMFLKDSFSFSPLKKGSTYLYVIGAIVLMFVIQFIIVDVLKLEGVTEQIETLGFDTLAMDWLSITILFIAITVLAPIKEEVIFRGLFYKFLSKKWGFWLGLIISSVAFGLLHPDNIVSASFMGIILVLLYKQTRSLLVPIMLHFVWNVYAFIGLVLYVNNL